MQGENTMANFWEDFFEERPQRLCKMCGKCCKLSTTTLPYNELKTMCDEGHEGAVDFLRIFEPYDSIEEARKNSPQTVDNIVKSLENNPEARKSLTFYKCKYIQDNNLCGIYQDRPELCDRFPASPWAVVPPGCGFEGWLFQKSEALKQKVRKQKENLLDFEIMLQTATPEQAEKIQAAIEKTKNIIESYSKYGSADW